MWIRRSRYLELVHAAKLESVQRQIAERQLKVLEVNLDWMRFSLNQANRERGALLEKVADVKLAVPELVKPIADPLAVHPLTEMPSFEDVGEKEAARLKTLGALSEDAAYTPDESVFSYSGKEL